MSARADGVDIERLRSAAQARLPSFLDALADLVGIDSGTFTPDGVGRVVDAIERRMAGDGWSVERRPHVPAAGEPQLGDLLIGTFAGGGGQRILLAGHTDTVFDPGTAAARPFRILDGRATGPGVADMQSGLLLGVEAVALMSDAGLDGFERITYVCNPDEEIGSPFSGPVIRELAGDHDVAFVLEAARPNGDVVTARKGIAEFVLRFEGRAAHAGVEPERGRSAVVAASRATLALQALNGRWPGVTVNAGVIGGGTRANVVAERCELRVDVRAVDAHTFAAARSEIERISASTDDGVTCEVGVEGMHPPMPKGEGSTRLAALAAELASRIGVELGDTATGGASDANTTADAGTPTLDGLGPVGGDPHSSSEWLDVSSIPDRTALLAALIASS